MVKLICCSVLWPPCHRARADALSTTCRVSNQPIHSWSQLCTCTLTVSGILSAFLPTRRSQDKKKCIYRCLVPLSYNLMIESRQRDDLLTLYSKKKISRGEQDKRKEFCVRLASCTGRKEKIDRELERKERSEEKPDVQGLRALKQKFQSTPGFKPWSYVSIGEHSTLNSPPLPTYSFIKINKEAKYFICILPPKNEKRKIFLIQEFYFCSKFFAFLDRKAVLCKKREWPFRHRTNFAPHWINPTSPRFFSAEFFAVWSKT